MEMRSTGALPVLFLMWAMLLLTNVPKAQSQAVYTLKKGRVYIQLQKPVTDAALDSFMVQFDLADLPLQSFLKTGNDDSLSRLGWKVETNNEVAMVISKALEPYADIDDPEGRIVLKKREPVFPAVNNGVVYGVNKFLGKAPFVTKDSTVRFFLRGYKDARRAMLAGSFNNWNPGTLAMHKVDSGWTYEVKLGPGKYWYKFIVDGNWMIDRDNGLSENDGRGNINSVFFRPNSLFVLPGFTDARNVSLVGSFNTWRMPGLSMKKTRAGWELPLYLADGTYTYKFVVDGAWHTDPANPKTTPDGKGGVNNVIQHGKPHVFHLAGYSQATDVYLVGSFNGWRDFEWKMKKVADGWELPFVLGPGNYEYAFKVDGKLLPDPDNHLTSESSGHSALVIEPNYTFRLKGFEGAQKVFVAGDFNGWEATTLAMQREGDKWVSPVHLSVGKHLYKFIVDGKWIIDPANKLWEQNEYGSGNSVLWFE